MTSEKAKKIGVLLVDDHPIVREGVKASLESNPRIKIVGEASNGQEAVRQAKKLAPDVILMDINMPKMSGLEATRIIHKKNPQSKVVVLSMFENQAYVMESIRAGAQGYIVKGSSLDDLPRAIDAVTHDQTFFSPSISQAILNQYVRAPRALLRWKSSQISQREREVLALIAEGLSNKDIANRINVSVRTVETHRENIMRKLNLHSTAQLTRYAIAHKIV